MEHEWLRILHFAPETALSQRLAGLPHVEYVTTDLEAGEGVEVQADITALPFDAERFDLVLCSHVLEHVPDDHAAMRELRRVVGPAGLVVIATPVNYDQAATYEDTSVMDPAERLRRFSQADHVRVYGRDLRGRLEAAGFAVTVEDYAARVGDEAVSRYGLVPRYGPLRNDLYLCRPR